MCTRDCSANRPLPLLGLLIAATIGSTASNAHARNGLIQNACYYLQNWDCCDLDPNFRKVCGDPGPICEGDVYEINGIPQNPAFDRAVLTAPMQNGYTGDTFIEDGPPLECLYWEAFCAPAFMPVPCVWEVAEESNLNRFFCQSYLLGAAHHNCP